MSKTSRRVVVDGRYTYLTDEEVEVGDMVVLPTADWLRIAKDDIWVGQITSLESDYNGQCKWIIRVLPKKTA